MKQTLAAMAGAASLAACSSAPTGFLPASSAYTINQDEIAVRAVLAAQAKAWNRGDLNGFMQGYWRSPELRFASGGQVTRGWEAALSRYEARYTDRETMGALSFSQIEVDLVSADAALVHGAWRLDRERDDPGSGLFTLLFERKDGDWVIVSDTTTAKE